MRERSSPGAQLFTGIGAWGRYTGYQRISWQLTEDGGLFLHSGVLHVALKSGLLGMLLFGGLVAAFVAVARCALRTLPPEYLGLGAAGVAGVVFMLPDLLCIFGNEKRCLHDMMADTLVVEA